MGSMPTAVTIGITIGITRMIAAAECRNMPRMRKATLSSTSTTNLLLVRPVMACPSACGSCASVRNVPISAEDATSSITTAVCTPPSTQALRSSRQLRSR